MNIFLKSVRNPVNIGLTINSDDKIETYSQQINNLFDTTGYKLIYRGGVLDLKESFSKYDIHENDVIIVLPNKKPENVQPVQQTRQGARRHPIRTTESTGGLTGSAVSESVGGGPRVEGGQTRVVGPAGSGSGVASGGTGGGIGTNSNNVYEHIERLLSSMQHVSPTENQQTSTNSQDLHNEAIYMAFAYFAENVHNGTINLEQFYENGVFTPSYRFRELISSLLTQAECTLFLARIAHMSPNNIIFQPLRTYRNNHMPIQVDVVMNDRSLNTDIPEEHDHHSDDSDSEQNEQPEHLTDDDMVNIQNLVEFTGATEERVRREYIRCNKDPNETAERVLQNY